MRYQEYDPDGKGARPHPVYDMPPILVERDTEGDPYAVSKYYDYWRAVTDVDCPCCDAGTIRWAEAGHVPGYRVCNWCGRHFVADGSPESPTLIELDEYTGIIQSPI